MKSPSPIVVLMLFWCQANAQTSYTWTGAVSTAWNTAANWSPAGIPSGADNVTIKSAGNNCLLSANTGINNIAVTSGVLDLGGYTLTISGPAANFSTGTVQNGTVSVTGAATTVFGNGPMTMNCIVNVVSDAVTIRNTIFQNSAGITKTGASNDNSYGGNTFNGITTITNAGAGYIRLAGNAPDIFNGPADFNNTGGSNIYPAYNSAGNIFNGVTTFNNTPTGNTAIYISWYSPGTIFNDNIVVNSTNGLGVQFCGGNATASVTLSSGKTISIGAGGFSSGTLLLRQLTQTGATSQYFTLTGTGILTYGPSSSFGGDVSATSPSLFLNGTVFNGATSFTKTGTTGDYSTGGNVFNGVCSITNTGSNYILLGNANPDTWNDDVTFTNSGSERILVCWASAGNQFNGNIYVNSSGSATAIQFCNSAAATANLAAGKTIRPGLIGLTSGSLILKQFTQSGTAPVNLTATGSSVIYLGPSSSFGGAVSVTAPDIWAQGAVYNGPAEFTKTGGINNNNNQYQNIFNSTCTINQQSSTGYFMLGYNSNDLFGDDITVTSAGSGAVYLGGTSGAGTPTLAAGKTIRIGGAGFSSGSLYLEGFTQLGNAPVNLNLTGTTTAFIIGRGSAIGGDLTVVSPRILLNGATFAGAVNVTKAGSTGEWSAGGNLFNSTTTINQLGDGFFGFASGNPDTYNGDLYINNNSTERVLIGNGTVANQFNGNIILTQTGASQGIAFGWSANASGTLAVGKTISVGAAGFNTGYLQLKQFTQLGNAPVNLLLTGNTSLTIGPASAIGGDFNASAASLYFNGCGFSGTVDAVKTGATNDNSAGNNIFNGAAVITNAGSGNLVFGNGNSDQFNADATFNNTGSANIYIAHNSSGNIFGGVTTLNNNPTGNNVIYVSWYSAGTVFNDDIVVSSTNGQGVQFCGGNLNATATLVAARTIAVGPGGFTSGTLLLRQFTQTGSTAQSLTLTGTGNLTFGPSSSFGGNITTTSPALFFNGCRFDGTVNSVKTGATNDGSKGNNIFNAAFSVTNTGSGYLLMGNGNPDTWQSTAEFNNLSSGQNMYIAYNSSGNIFNGDVIFNNRPAGNFWIYPNSYGINTQFNGNISVVNLDGMGVSFGANTGTSTLAAGKTISIGAAGFNSGGLILKNFTQSGTGTPQSLTTTGTSFIQYSAGSSFDGALSSSSPGLFFNGSVFNGPVQCVKTGTTNDQSQGNNVFNGPAVFTNNGTGYLMMTVNNPDAYNDDVTFVKGNTGSVYPNYNGNSNYRGNLTVTSSSALTFGSNTGTATLSGAGLQTISATAGTPAPVFTRLIIANSGPGVTLNNTSVNVSKALTLNSGLLNTSGAYILTMLNGSVTAAGDALAGSYVNGPMQYQKSSSGSSVLNFPVGSSPDSRPLSLTVNHANSHLYTYQVQVLNASAAALGYTLPPTVDAVSGVHYYTIARMDAASVSQPLLDLSGNQTIEIFFGSNDVVKNGGTLTIVKNTYSAPANWIDIGGTGGPVYNGGANLAGSISSTSSPSAFNSFSTFALADKFGGANPLPIDLLYFNAKPVHDQVALTWATAAETNNSYFSIEKSRDGQHFELLQRIGSKAAGGNSSISLDYAATDINPFAGLSYYRLKQTDLDGNHSYSKIVSVSFGKNPVVSIYPNPTAGTIYISGIGESSLRIEWYDMSGRSLLQQTVRVQNGMVVLHPPFDPGVYVLRYIAPDGNSAARNIVIRR